jgi:hypothetical protein
LDFIESTSGDAIEQIRYRLYSPQVIRRINLPVGGLNLALVELLVSLP